MINEEKGSTDVNQLSARCYATDACYPLKINEEKFSELSRFKIVTQLKYQNHLKLMHYLKEGKSDVSTLSNMYDLFFQEGESNIQHQKETKGKVVCYDDQIQLYHEATGRYLKAIPVDISAKETGNKETFMTFKLGFSKHPDKYTHFSFASLFNKNKIMENKVIHNQDKAYLAMVEDKIEYHLVAGDEEFLLKSNEKQNMTVVKLQNEMGCQENEMQQKVKYVYLRHGQGNNFVVPVFDHEFMQYKLQHVGLAKISETTGLKFDFVWKCILHSEDMVSFIHCNSGILLSFDKGKNWEGSNGENGDTRNQQVLSMLESQE